MNRYTQEDDDIIIKCVNHCKNLTTAFKTAAKRLGRTEYAITNRYFRDLKSKPETKEESVTTPVLKTVPVESSIKKESSFSITVVGSEKKNAKVIYKSNAVTIAKLEDTVIIIEHEK
jgi:hypothetical protein